MLAEHGDRLMQVAHLTALASSIVHVVTRLRGRSDYARDGLQSERTQ